MIRKPGNPVLRHSSEDGSFYRHDSKSDGSIITKTQMIDDLGFRFELLFESKFMINARDVEDALQNYYQHLSLGRRLWRYPDRGAKWDVPDGSLHKVGIVFFDQILPTIKNGMLIVTKGFEPSSSSFYNIDEAESEDAAIERDIIIPEPGEAKDENILEDKKFVLTGLFPKSWRG